MRAPLTDDEVLFGEAGVSDDEGLLDSVTDTLFGEDDDSGSESTPQQSAGHSGSVGYQPQTRPAGKNTRHGMVFDRIVNAVSDLGWTADGTVNDIPVEDNTLIEVPDGEFVVDKAVLKGTENWGIVGLGENVTLRVPDGKCMRLVQCSSNDLSKNVLLENLTFDQRDGMQAGLELRINVTDGLHIENCRRVGETPNRDTAGDLFGEEPVGILVAIHESSGSGTITNWTDHCETEVVGYPKNSQGIFAGWSCKGTLSIVDSSIRYQGEHAIYGSKARKLHLDNCELLDNANTNCRIAGDGSYARNCTIGYTRDAAYTDHHDGKEGRKATKGLRMEHSREYGVSGGEFEQCHFVWTTDGLQSPVLVYIMGNVGGVTFTDCLVQNDTDAETVVIDAEGTGWRGYDIPGDATIYFENTRFEGSSDHPPVKSARDGGAVLSGCEIAMPNAAPCEGVQMD